MRDSRTVRIFLSSTFRDFGEERDIIVRKVFPGLRARIKERFVELVDVDLRWGITVEQAERGEVLPICLVEIDRARPYFVGMLGERYGWIPPRDAYALDLLERQPVNLALMAAHLTLGVEQQSHAGQDASLQLAVQCVMFNRWLDTAVWL